MNWESILMMFLIALGSFQAIAAWADFKGMSFFNHRVIGIVFGVVLVIGGFTWFFVAVDVGQGGPKGQHDDQALSTFVGGGVALLVTWFVPSIIKYKSIREFPEDADNPEGIEALKYMTFLQAIRSRSNMNRKDK